MPNGGEHYEQVGFCPHCRSGAIRQRRRLHRRMNWRCGTCKRVFYRPEFREAAVYSNTRYVSEGQVARVESRVARRWNSRRRRRRVNWRLNFWAIMVAIVVVLIAAYFYFAPRLPDQFRLTTIEWLNQSKTEDLPVPLGPSITMRSTSTPSPWISNDPKRLNLSGILTSDTRTGVLDFNPHWLDSMGLHVPNHELFAGRSYYKSIGTEVPLGGET